jgi:adenylate kinase
MPPVPTSQLVLLFGGPGAGKGTQARQLSAALSVPHISSGDVLRERQRQGAALSAMERGDLLPDDMVADMVFARLSEPDAARGAVLDGFPRNLAQAYTLDNWLAQHAGAVSAAIYLAVPDSALVTRIVGRREVSQRGDDTADTAARRVEVFLKELPGVLGHYAAQGVLHRIDGTQSVDEVQQQITQALQTKSK